MDELKFPKSVLLTLFIVAISLPYLIHCSQDLPFTCSHDEAYCHMNAKDIVLFGPSSLKGNKLFCLINPLGNMLAVTSFFFFGNSLLTLRLPYIVLNIIGNILLLILLCKTRGLWIAVLVMLAFSLYAPRLIIGKSAVNESMGLALVLTLLWMFERVRWEGRRYFWIGMLGMLIFWSKLDNVVIPLFLTGLVLREWHGCRDDGNIRKAAIIARSYIWGVVLVIGVACIFYHFAGWERVVFTFAYPLKPNLNLSSWNTPSNHNPLSIDLFLDNFRLLYRAYPGFVIASMVCTIPFGLLSIYAKREKDKPLARSICLLLCLIGGKLALSTLFCDRRFAPCFPLPFLLIAYLAGRIVDVAGNSAECENAWGQVRRFTALFLAAAFCGVLIYICYFPDIFEVTKKVIIFPTYRHVYEAERINSLLKKGREVLYLDGTFAYIGIQSPIKFSDVPPDINAECWDIGELNYPLVRERIASNPKIGYVLYFEEERTLVYKRMLEEEFHAEMLDNVADQGLLYRIRRTKNGQ